LGRLPGGNNIKSKFLRIFCRRSRWKRNFCIAKRTWAKSWIQHHTMCLENYKFRILMNSTIFEKIIEFIIEIMEYL
jgi:hypothetical protein